MILSNIIEYADFIPSNNTKIKSIKFIGGFMVKYKVNLVFKDASISLNEIVTKVLKIELQKKFNMICNYYFQLEGNK